MIGAQVKRSPDEDDGGANNKNSKKTRRSKLACVYCARLKMKCSGSVPCERCIRVGRECRLPEQAIRQPWSRKKDLEIQMLNNRLEEMEKKLHEKDATIMATGYPTSNSEASASTPLRASASDSSLLRSSVGGTNDTFYRLPFVHSGRINLEEAKDLFELFMQNCVLHVALVDPEWHSYNRVSKDCTFLFACIIYIAASYHPERSTLQEELRPEMNDLIGRVVSLGDKSVSIVQGFLFLYFFNQPPANAEHDTAWLYSGIAIRLASELNMGSAKKQGKETPRERIDRERTWMMTFIVDRSLSTSRGKAWTIRGDDSIVRNSDSWCDQPACRSWDLAISTLADLLKVTSRQIDALSTTLSAKSDFDESFDCETMMRIMNEELEEWRRRWQSRGIFTSTLDNELLSSGGASGSTYSSPLNDATTIDVHKRTYHYLSKQGALRYNYAVLVLNCFGLQYCASNPSKSSAKTYILTQAIRAAQNIVKAATEGLQYTVAYSPHSQCTIVTFGIISLIKLASLKRDDLIVSQRLLQMVEVGITFLESVAIRPTHVAARSASFLRGLLRRSLMGESNEATFRPGMEVHHLPARSSRPGTPIREAMSINGDMMMARTPPPPPPPHPPNHAQHAQQLYHHHHHQQQQQYHNHQHTPIDPQLQDANQHMLTPQQTIMYGDGGGGGENGNLIVDSSNNIGLPWNFVSNDTLDLLANSDPSLLFGKEGSTGFGGLTADELLNDSFWLRLPQRSPI